MINRVRGKWNARTLFQTTLLIALMGVLVAPLWPQSAASQPTAAKTAQSPSDQPPAVAGTLPNFDAISVKLSDGADPRGALQFQPGGRLVAINIPLRPLFSMAYNLALSQGRGGAIIGAPSWFDSERYNIEAKANGDPPREQMILMFNRCSRIALS